jgi:hypothetical protein
MPSILITADAFSEARDHKTLSWEQIVINKNFCHDIPIGNRIKEAKDRREERLLTDIDSLFRFSLGGKERPWGIREGRVFQILW